MLALGQKLGPPRVLWIASLGPEGLSQPTTLPKAQNLLVMLSICDKKMNTGFFLSMLSFKPSGVLLPLLPRKWVILYYDSNSTGKGSLPRFSIKPSTNPLNKHNTASVKKCSKYNDWNLVKWVWPSWGTLRGPPAHLGKGSPDEWLGHQGGDTTVTTDLAVKDKPLHSNAKRP